MVPEEEDGPLRELSLRPAVLAGTIFSELEATGKGEEVTPMESLEVYCVLIVAMVRLDVAVEIRRLEVAPLSL